MAMFKYVLFDLDGTLTDSGEGIAKCFQYALKHFGIQENNMENLRRVMGPPLKDSFLHFYGLSESQAEEAVKKYRERYNEKGMYENRLYDGIEELLKKLSGEGIKLAVASSKSAFFVGKICEHYKIKQYFHHFTAGNEDGSRSSKYEVVRDALKEFGEIEKDKAVLVGDRSLDVDGGHKCEIKVIGAAYGFGGRKELLDSKADIIVESVEELGKLLLSGQ